MENILNLQLALFFTDVIRRPDKLIDGINEATGNLFDGIPQILDIPMEAPMEIPVVLLKSETGIYLCNISRGRIDFIYNDNNLNKEWSSVISDFYAKTQLIIKHIGIQHSINRFGIIGNFFIEDKNPAWQINRKYMKHEITDVDEIIVRYNKRKEMYGLVLNNITHIEASINQITQTKGIVIQRDINNNPTDANISIENIIKIIDISLKDYSSDEMKKLVK